MSDFSDVLFELGTEELPPTSLFALSQALRQGVAEGLARAGFQDLTLHDYATPRRLGIFIESLPLRQPDQWVERRGPAVKSAFQADGSPTPALQGFLRGAGATVDQLITQETDKGAWLSVRLEVKGAAVESLLPDLFRGALQGLPIAKRMRWGDGLAEFVRPVHWVVLLLGDQVVPAEILGVETNRISHGHRIHAKGPIVLRCAADYARQMEEQGFVRVSFSQRRDQVRTAAEALALSVGGVVRVDEALLDEVTSLVEWPVPILGAIESRYLRLPAEVLITTLKTNQKYFPVHGPDGALLPYFITFSNLDSACPTTIREGNERVVRPRLADAEFFYEQDRKRSLESRINDLRQVTFQNQLGSLYDKSERVARLAEAMAVQLGVETGPLVRAAWLAKTDLMTSMVGEFPELQGTMGRYYAALDGESSAVATAIEEHYLPKAAGGKLPETPVGRLLAVADKLDTLCGIFSAGLIPTGDRDPYALRRAAIGVLRLAIETELDLDLLRWIREAHQGLPTPAVDEAACQKVLDFCFDRLRGYLIEKGARPDEFESVLAIRPSSPLDFSRRLRAVQGFRRLPEADSLAAANKRICNLLRKAGGSKRSLNSALFTEPAECSLHAALEAASVETAPALALGDYTAALRRLADLKTPIDAFFEAVMVLADEEDVRENRLALLAGVEGLFLKIADISKLQA